ncbi:hypothetical protein CNMCM6805_006189 [Aspergillus fumigatiaffinis]|uniref:Uncharacterized protein n=1 Tax=Aspergillus fumigatiaffinis TaxID=340414 RepID=A0A8H4MB75_9EURO|nr:hypothetical protein CNMCM6805_006189 [Aspergillus fumigatiaffinis]
MLTRGGKAGPQHVWEFEGRFSEFVHEETNAWRQRGTERPAHFLLRPSGTIAAPIAHHLLNPTFYVTNPYSNETDDASNPTIYLLHKNGFSSQNSFMFDQICRREETLIYLHLWTDNVQKPRDDFVRDLRQNMSAIVEICWGEVVWRKVELQGRLIRFPLWGKYKDVKLYLDLEDDEKTLKRFVFWVHHPQWFFRPRPVTTTNGVPDRTIQAKIQDALAARFAGLSIRDNFYEQYPHNKYPRLTKEQRDVRENLMESAREETRAAFPMKAQEEEERQSRLKSKRKEQRRQIRQILQELEKDQEKEAQDTLSEMLRKILIL